MAEFTEVIRQQRRMCKAYARCEGCPVRWIVNPNKCVCYDLAFENPAMFEERVMKWAEEHPESVYPTWEEWNRAISPKAARPICMLNFAGKEACHDWDWCCECLKQRIPADIAAKLGIKPIEVKK